MKTNKISVIARVAALAVLAVGLGAAQASAQAAAGSFTLPFAVQWGGATLPAGHYSFALNDDGAASILTLRQAGGGVAMILNQGWDQETSGPSELVVVRNAEGSYVRELHLPIAGEVLTYARPKSMGRAEAAEATVQAVTIVIATK